MPSITIRNLSVRAHRELVTRASLQGKSLQEYVRTHLEDWTDKPDMQTWLARVRANKEKFGGVELDIERLLEYKDADKR